MSYYHRTDKSNEQLAEEVLEVGKFLSNAPLFSSSIWDKIDEGWEYRVYPQNKDEALTAIEQLSKSASEPLKKVDSNTASYIKIYRKVGPATFVVAVDKRILGCQKVKIEIDGWECGESVMKALNEASGETA